MDETLQAFQWLLSATNSQIKDLINEIRYRPNNVFPEYNFVLEALLSLAED